MHDHQLSLSKGEEESGSTVEDRNIHEHIYVHIYIYIHIYISAHVCIQIYLDI